MSSYAAAYNAWHSASYVSENTWRYVYQHTVSFCTRGRISSTLLRGPCTPLASYSCTGCQCRLCNLQVFGAVVILKLTYASPAWWGFSTSTDRQRIDAVLRHVNKSGFWTSAVSSDFPTFGDLCSSVDEELLLKLILHSRTTYCMHYSCHDPPHQNDTTSDGEHTPFNSVDTPPVFLTVVFLLKCYSKTVISFFIFCILFIFVHCLLACVLSCLLYSKMYEWMKTAEHRSRSSSSVSVDGHTVEVTDKFVYLGSTVDSAGYSSTVILRRLGLASSVMGQLDRVWLQNRLSLATKLRIYITCVLPVGLYGAETRTHKGCRHSTWPVKGVS